MKVYGGLSSVLPTSDGGMHADVILKRKLQENSILKIGQDYGRLPKDTNIIDQTHQSVNFASREVAVSRKNNPR